MNKRRALVVLALAIVVAVSIGLWRSAQPIKGNVLVLMLDTLRADHLGAYGYQRATSPNIDHFAQENVRFSYTVTAAPWTPPSVASMFTGVYPATHGWMPPNIRPDVKEAAIKLEDKLVTLAEIFQANGYSTVAVSSNPWISEDFGYQQGFETFIYRESPQAEKIVKIGEAQIDRLLKEDKPFFMYLHFIDPHDPYTPPDRYKSAFTDAVPGKHYSPRELKYINHYDGEIKYMDAQIGRLFSYLKEQGLYDDLTIILVADHGEQFMEHGQHGHGHQLFNEEVHVPLIVKSPKVLGARVVNITTSTIDVFPTALDAAGIKVTQDIPGVSLLNDTEIESRQGVFTEIQKAFKQRAFTT
ncbi:MAG: sulfatase, partial [Proteobacteria bacterium]|nr:sulfatase [Pseudomonadota bacterium]